MNYKIAVCDDSAADRQYIIDQLRQWSATFQNTVTLCPFLSAEDFLFHYTEQNDFDILLLDIEMGDMDGVTLAKKLREENETLQIIFITGYSDYISEGYEVAALHYLMKPVNTEKLFSVLNRAIEKLQKNEKVLHFEIAGEMVRIPLYQIRFIDVQLNYATIHSKEDITLKKSLNELTALLDDRFYRVGRSAIVNLTCISKVTKSEIYLNDGTTVPLPRGAYEGLNRAIINM